MDEIFAFQQTFADFSVTFAVAIMVTGPLLGMLALQAGSY
jgi:hypothetical protein